MARPGLPRLELASSDFYDAAVLTYGSVRKAATALGIPRSTFHDLQTGKRTAPSYGSLARVEAALAGKPAREKKLLANLSNYIPTLDPRQFRVLKQQLAKPSEKTRFRNTFSKKTGTAYVGEARGKRPGFRRRRNPTTREELIDAMNDYLQLEDSPDFHVVLGYPRKSG